MPLSVSHFQHVARGFRTHKEAHEKSPKEAPMSKDDVEEIKARFEVVPGSFVEQCARVRKYQRVQVEKLLEEMVEFRERQQWPIQHSVEDLNPLVIEHEAHEIGMSPEGLPMLIMRTGKVDGKIAKPKDFQQHAAFMLEQITMDNIQAQEKGIAFMLDFSKSSFSVLRHMGGDDLSRGLGLFRKFPVKIKKVYVMNASMSVRFAIKAVLFVASKTVRNKVEFLS